MSRFSIESFVLLCALFMSAFFSAVALASPACNLASSSEICNFASSSEICNRSEHTTFDLVQEHPGVEQMLISPTGEEVIPKIHLAEVTEGQEEEHELRSAKKHLKCNHFVPVILAVRLFGYFFGHIKKSLPFSKHFSYSAPYQWYLILRVIRL